jgi:hypothetical protein
MKHCVTLQMLVPSKNKAAATTEFSGYSGMVLHQSTNTKMRCFRDSPAPAEKPYVFTERTCKRKGSALLSTQLSAQQNKAAALVFLGKIWQAPSLCTK